MRKATLTLLGVFGLAPAGHLQQAQALVAERDGHVSALQEKLARQVEATAAERAALTETRAGAEAAAARQAEMVRELEAALAEAREQGQHWKQRSADAVQRLHDLRGRLEQAERVETQIRDVLMVSEAKLDLVEAAINALDRRTRPEPPKDA